MKYSYIAHELLELIKTMYEITPDDENENKIILIQKQQEGEGNIYIGKYALEYIKQKIDY